MSFIHWRRVAMLLMMILLWGWGFSLMPAMALDPGEIMMEKPTPPEEKKEEAPATCGPIISDCCLPIETSHASMQILWGYSFVGGNFTQNWRKVSAGGNFSTFSMPVKFTYGPAKNLEMYIVVPFIHNFAGKVDDILAGPNGERSANYGGIGDITMVGKYLLLPEAEIRPAVTGVVGVGIPSGHAHHLNPGRLGQDAIGTGSVNFITGVNLYKWLKPFLVYSNIWLNTPVNIFRLSNANDSVRSREFVTFNLATEYPITKKWIALVEMYSTWTWETITTPQGFQSPSTLVGVLPGIEYLFTEKVAASAGAAIDLFGKGGSLKYTPMLSVYYSF